MRTAASTRVRALSLLVAGMATVAMADPYQDAPAYVKPVVAGASLGAIVTVGQKIPLHDGLPGETFRIVGIPDGMGASKVKGGVSLLVNHEFAGNQGGVAGPFAAGARVSEIFLDVKPAKDPVVATSGHYPVIDAYNGDDPILVPPMTRRISRLCSAFLATKDVGFDRNILLHGEEASSGTYDADGPQAFATFEGATYALPRMGRAAWENVVAVPHTKDLTVVFGLEDGPSFGSELYLYVGQKVKGSPDALLANGLRNGELYVFVSNDPVKNSEATFTVKGDSIDGRFEYVDWSLNAAGLAAASTAAGAFEFVRVEDGASDLREKGVLWFVTTGAAGTANPFGRLYRFDYDVKDPLYGPVRLTLVLDGSEGIVSPDNIDINRHGEIAIQEDPTYDLSTLPQSASRDSSIFIYDTKSGQLTRIAEIDYTPASAHALLADPLNQALSYRPGDWETSGIIDAEDFLGRGAWLFNVQAHTLRIAPSAETVQGGQVLSLVYRRKK